MRVRQSIRKLAFTIANRRRDGLCATSRPNGDDGDGGLVVAADEP
jgi:hypothetical protein